MAVIHTLRCNLHIIGIIVLNFNILCQKMKKGRVTSCETDFKYIWPKLLTTSSYRCSESYAVIFTPLAITVSNMNTLGQRIKEESRLQVVLQILSKFDHAIWLQCHIGDLEPLLSFTHHRQLMCQIWTLLAKQMKEKLAFWVIILI